MASAAICPLKSRTRSEGLTLLIFVGTSKTSEKDGLVPFTESNLCKSERRSYTFVSDADVRWRTFRRGRNVHGLRRSPAPGTALAVLWLKRRRSALSQERWPEHVPLMHYIESDAM